MARGPWTRVVRRQKASARPSRTLTKMLSHCGSRADGWQSEVDPFCAGVVSPRGEVGLFFAAIGRELRSGGKAVVNEATYTVGMVMVTTLITPPLLSWSMNSRAKRVLTP